MIPLYNSEPIKSLPGADGQHFTIVFGLDKSMVDQFTRSSCDLCDAELHRFTSDYKRICQGGYEAWYAKERYPFALLDAEGALAGLIWFGPKAFPPLVPTSQHQSPISTGWHTFAIRMYPPYRGKGLAFPFAQAVIAAHTERFPGVPIWLDTDTENAGAIRLYEKLGFVHVGEKTAASESEDGRLVMTYAPR